MVKNDEKRERKTHLVWVWLNKQQKLNWNKMSFSLSFFIIFNHLAVKCYSVAWQRKFPSNFFILCVRVKINKCSFELFGDWILFWNASSHSVSDFCTLTSSDSRQKYFCSTSIDSTTERSMVKISAHVLSFLGNSCLHFISHLTNTCDFPSTMQQLVTEKYDRLQRPQERTEWQHF